MLTPGTKLGPYEIVAAIGAGGMGEVYRARDPRLGRDVAIKISAERFSDRFEREARAIAALNHPHVCTLHDVGPNYLVMEFVDGPTLADRIQQGPVPLDEALRVARQIADALDAAHGRGIVHRDLKPANVKLTPDNVVKVLDFGLAKAPADDPRGLGSGNPSMSPTISPATELGVILGTAAYMAPEQARGLAVDKRADIWAFGVVLYEMLRGRRLFHGDTTSDTIAAVLTLEPAWDAMPDRVRPLLQRCLAKDPKLRLRDIGDVDLLLRDAPAGAAPVTAGSRIAWAVAAGALVAAAALAVVHFREQPQRAAPIRFQIPTPIPLAESGNIALSPDGRQLAFLGTGADSSVKVWIRSMDSLDVRPIEGAETAQYGPPLFWSPDGQFIAYDGGDVLKRISASGGVAQVIANLNGRPAIGGSWNRRGDIIIGGIPGGLRRVSDRGGELTPITALDPARSEETHLVPTFLPDDRHFLYYRISRKSPDQGGVYVGTLDVKPEEQDKRRLLPYAPGLTYAPATAGSIGHVLLVRDGMLIAQPFDERRLELAGDAIQLAQQVGAFLDTAFLSSSRNGVIAYRTGDPPFAVSWYDRRGNMMARVSEPGQFASVSLSPDGSRIVASLTNPRDRSKADLWLLDAAGGGASRLTFDPVGRSDFPVWSPDQRSIAFRSGVPGGMQLWAKFLNSGADDRVALMPPANAFMTPTSWSPDGKFLLYSEPDPATSWDLWLLPMNHGHPSGDRPVRFVGSRFNEEDGHFSPDGRWIAFTSNESGAKEVYVREFGGGAAAEPVSAGSSVLVSRGGGSSPRWRRDGRELFYLSGDQKMMGVPVTAGADFHAAAPTPLFQAPPGAIVGDVSADGQRFLMVGSATAPFTVVVGWAKP